MSISQAARAAYYASSPRLHELMGLEDYATLRRAAMTLRRWYEEECNGTIQRDEADGKPYRYSAHTGDRIGKTSDRERGAEKTVCEVCGRLGLRHFLQTDPRGGTLYVSREPLNQSNYSSQGVFVA